MHNTHPPTNTHTHTHGHVFINAKLHTDTGQRVSDFIYNRMLHYFFIDNRIGMRLSNAGIIIIFIHQINGRQKKYNRKSKLKTVMQYKVLRL